MKPVNLSGLGLVKEQAVRDALGQIERASAEADLSDISQAFSFTGTLTETRVLNLTAPSLANIAAVLGTFILDCKRGGATRTT